MKLLQINVTVNWGSTGRIAEQIGQMVLSQGWESYIAYGRGSSVSKSQLIRIGSRFSIYWHVLMTRLFDRHGLASKRATKKLIEQIKEIQPDIIHLHNIHGYYVNYEFLLAFLAEYNKPIVWTLHDCWNFTGHCAFFDSVNCSKWEKHCLHCPLKYEYPTSIFRDRSAQNFDRKKKAVEILTHCVHLVPVSNWLRTLLKRSYMREMPAVTIHNGIDLSIFSSNSTISSDLIKEQSKFIVLGVASVWDSRKGLGDFMSLRKMLPVDDYGIVLVGLSDKQCAKLPPDINGVFRTENIKELVALYASADVFVNPTYSDNYPTTNLEAMACGTPVITYRTGGSPEAVTEQTGLVVEQGDVEALAEAIKTIKRKGKSHYSNACRQRAEQHFDKEKSYLKYLELYKSLLEGAK